MIEKLFALSFGLVIFLMASDLKASDLKIGDLVSGEMVSAGQRSSCAHREVVLQKLQDTFGERRRGMGLVSNIGIVELYASEQTGTWTITLTRPNGLTCIMSSGIAFEALDAQSETPEGEPV